MKAEERGYVYSVWVNHYYPRKNARTDLRKDAGGTRGISQLKILTELMAHLNLNVTEDHKLCPCDVFDLIGGAGTGG
jgi:patatin-like phospholipase/acyl hydrolase